MEEVLACHANSRIKPPSLVVATHLVEQKKEGDTKKLACLLRKIAP